MMKNMYKIISVLLVLTFSSCEDDVLDTSPKGTLAEGVSNSTTVDKLVTASYNGLLQRFYFDHDRSYVAPANNWTADVRSDDAYKGGGGITDRADIHELETATLDASSYPAEWKWTNLAYAVSRTNYAIREIQALEDNTYPKETRLGEVRLLRGHFHFEWIRNFGRVPFIAENDDPTAISNTDYSRDEVFELIEEDLLFAFENLPTSQDEIGRVNKYIAAAYLAKLYIETEQWTKAIEKADFVISGPYALLNDFNDLYTLAYENGSESVFTIQYNTENLYIYHDWGSLLNVTTSPGIDAGGYAAGDDFYHGSQNLVNAYRTDQSGLPLLDSFNDVDVLDGSYSGNLDPRLDYTVGRVGIPWKGETAVYSDSWIRSTDYPGYSQKKQVVAPNEPSINETFPWAAAGLNYHIIRFAEVLLWKAEALIESGQNLEEARTLINQIRQRALNSTYVQKIDGSGPAANYQIASYPAENWNQTYARQAVRFERRLELALEGHRLFDIIRWGNAASTINTYFAESDRFYLQGAVFVAGKNEYLPIPQTEIDLSPDLYEQVYY